MEPAWINSRQIEAARRAIVRQMRRSGQSGFASSGIAR
jgi:ribosomal protein L16/L10AE